MLVTHGCFDITVCKSLFSHTFEALDQFTICGTVPPVFYGPWTNELEILGIKVSDGVQYGPIELLLGADVIGYVIHRATRKITLWIDWQGDPTRLDTYGLPQDIYQTAKVAKVLLLLEKGRGKEFKGKNLNEIELEKDIYYSSESEEDIAEEEQTVKKQTLTQENKTLNSETKNTSGNKEDVNRRSDQETYKNKRVPREGKKAENKASETGEDITLPSKTPKAIKAIVRWSISEKETAASEPATYKDFLGVFFLPMALKWLKTYRGEGRGKLHVTQK
ncbi:hypothetical protein HUJ05_004342 [Dendroctonus ponderosae]|nr:hypothetical protein HUJ05_004342 [Dendroctonus ponderosae]